MTLCVKKLITKLSNSYHSPLSNSYQAYFRSQVNSSSRTTAIMVANYVQQVEKTLKATLLNAVNDALDLLVKEVNSLGDDEDINMDALATKVKAHFKGLLQEATVVAGGKKAKKAKKEKDENAPKAALTAFFCYANEVRPKIRKDKPELKMVEVSKAISAMWNKLSEKEKEPYVAMAAKDKERYEAQKKEYVKA